MSREGTEVKQEMTEKNNLDGKHADPASNSRI